MEMISGVRRGVRLLNLFSKLPSAAASQPPLQRRTFNRELSERSVGIGEKARSTADEFLRQAKEKVESGSQGVEESWEGLKESATSGTTDTESAKEKFKEKFKATVEKGNDDKIGKG